MGGYGFLPRYLMRYMAILPVRISGPPEAGTLLNNFDYCTKLA